LPEAWDQRNFARRLPISGPSAPESAHQQRGESPRRTEHWLSAAEGNCVTERWGGEKPEANNQSIRFARLQIGLLLPLAPGFLDCRYRHRLK